MERRDSHPARRALSSPGAALFSRPRRFAFRDYGRHLAGAKIFFLAHGVADSRGYPGQGFGCGLLRAVEGLEIVRHARPDIEENAIAGIRLFSREVADHVMQDFAAPGLKVERRATGKVMADRGFSPVRLNHLIATDEAFRCYRLLGERF